MFLDEKVICPSCGSERHLKAFKLSNEVLDIANLAGKFGRNWPWALEYARCFQSSLDKPLRPIKLKTILEEVLEIIEKNGFTFDRKWHSVRPNAIYAALREVALLNKVSFRNHHYFFKVCLGVNQRLIEKEETEQRARAHEAQRRDSGGQTEGATRMKKLIEGIGR